MVAYRRPNCSGAIVTWLIGVLLIAWGAAHSNEAGGVLAMIVGVLLLASWFLVVIVLNGTGRI